MRKAVAKHTEEAVKQGFYSDQTRKQITHDLSRARVDDFTITDDLSKEIVRRLAPFSFQGKIMHRHVTAGSSPFHPLTSILDVLDRVEHPKETIDIKNDSTMPALWLAGSIGCSTTEHLAALNARQIPATPVLASQYDESDRIRWGMQPWQDFLGKAPFDIAQSGLGTVRSKHARTFELPTVFVLGDSIRDFCLYYCLHRLHGRAFWIPSWFLENATAVNPRILSGFSNAAEVDRFDQAAGYRLTSASVSLPDAEKVVKSLANSHILSSLSTQGLSIPFVANLVEYPLRVYARGNIEKLSTHQLLDDELPGPFESMKPLVLEPVNPQVHRWVVEVAFLKHKIPRHPALGTLVAADSNLGEWSVRTGNEGLAYMCPGSVVIGNDPDFNLVRPSIRVPNALDLFRRVLSHCGYESEISDKGRYESEMIAKLGGIESAGRLFRRSNLRALFEKFLDQSGPEEGIFDEGVPLKDERRYLNFDSIVKLLESTASAIAVIDDYISKEVFYRGLILKCSHCSNLDWFSISDVTHTFTCRRCGKNQQYKKSNWKHPDEPSWFYKLDEIAYQMLVNNGVVPILTLAAIREKCKDSFLFCPELRIRERGDNKHFMELDICCIPDGKLCIGEAKSNGTLASKGISASTGAMKYQHLAVRLGATRVVFSTSADTWENPSEVAIDAAFGTLPHIQVSKWAASNL